MSTPEICLLTSNYILIILRVKFVFVNHHLLCNHRARHATCRTQGQEVTEVSIHDDVRAQKTRMILDALERHKGNVAATARALSMDRSTLEKWISNHSLRQKLSEIRAKALLS